jgi:hypothetical protein
MVKRRRTDEDSPWKEVLERYFRPFLAFFFPVAHAAIDWTKDHVFLDKELQKAVRDAALGRRLVDKLVQVHTLEGSEAWVLVHVEVQGDEDADLPNACMSAIIVSLIATTAEWPVWRC